MQDLLHPRVHNAAPLASLPNLAALEHPAHVSNGLVLPGYAAQPAPLGLTDYGLGATPYSYNASYMEGQVTFTAAPNVTQPAATNVIAPSAAAERLGYVGSEYEFGIQLNTIGVNLTIPGTYDATTNNWSGYIWAQNVVNWNSTGVHFIQDTWNFSLDSFGSWSYDSIYSGCGGDEAHANYILYIYGVFQCSEGNIPITPADYPVTLSIYNNITTNAQNRSQIVYGYSIYEAGTGTTISGVADTVVFNNNVPSSANPLAPSNAPANTVNPFAPTPTYGVNSGFWQDSEIDIVGGIEGDNGVFTSINGSAQLMYANVSAPDLWQNVPSAYNFGSDTGETSTGIADYWTPSHVLEINQGPSMLYGLWGAEPQSSVASGDMQIKGSITPSYGFVFVSNTPPVLYPWSGTEQDNMSWLPTDSTGAFNTYLPPLTAPWTTRYYIQAFADGYAEYNGSVTHTTTHLHIAPATSHGFFDAPFYMSTDAQAAALAVVAGSLGTAPYVFTGLTVNSNFTFDHVNDWDFPTFEVFQSQGVNQVYVQGVYLGTDSNGPNDNSYIGDYVSGGQTGLFTPPPDVYLGLPYYSSGIDIYYGTADRVFNQNLEEYHIGLGDSGLQLTLWGDTDAWVNGTQSNFDYPGVWVGDSTDTLVTNTMDANGYGVSDVGSTGTLVANLTVDSGIGVSAAGSFDSLYTELNVSDSSTGIEAGSDFGPAVSSIYDIPGTVGLTVVDENVTTGSLGANITFSTGTTFVNLVVNDSTAGTSQGIQLDGASDTVVLGLQAINASGFYVENATNLTFAGLVIQGPSEYSENSQVFASTNVVFDSPFLNDTGAEVTILGEYDTGIALNDPLVEAVVVGIAFGYSSNFTATDATSIDCQIAYEVAFSGPPITVSGVNAVDDYIGFALYDTAPASVSGVNSEDGTGLSSTEGAGLVLVEETGAMVVGVSAYESVGVRLIEGSTGNTVTSVSAWSYASSAVAVGVEMDNVSGNIASFVTASDYAIGVLVDQGSQGNSIGVVTSGASATGVEFSGSLANTVSGVNATGGSVGVVVDPSLDVTISDVNAAGHSRGVYIQNSTGITVATVTSAGNSEGVVAYKSNAISITNVTVSPGAIGVLAQDSRYVTISDVSATGTGVPLSPFAYSAAWSLPAAAVDTVGSIGVTVTGVTATDFPAALYDDGSSGLTVTALNATGSYYGLVLNGTASSLFSGIGAYQDYQGMLFEAAATDNLVTGSSFVDDSSYGVAVSSGTGNTVYNNQFLGDNGATGVYNVSHIQSFATGLNNFYICTSPGCTTGVGNYWADWHTYGPNGYLAPYWLSGSSVDEFPIGPQETFSITFTEMGLPSESETSWSVTLAGMTESSYSDTITFLVPIGTYSFEVNNVPGYTVSPSSGVVNEVGSTYNVQVTFSAIEYAVTLNAGGLASGVVWSATVNEVTQSTTAGSSLVFWLPSGTYDYEFNSVTGYTLGDDATGAVTVVDSPVSLAVTYTTSTAATYAVTLSAGGLASGVVWSATVNGVTQSTTAGNSLVYYLASGSYSYAFNAVTGYTLGAGTSGTVTVVGSPVSIAGTYVVVPTPPTPATYAVTLSEGGLAAGTVWSATVNGATQSTSGMSLVFYLASGAYSYAFHDVAGYTLGANATGTVTVVGAPLGIAATYVSSIPVTYAVTLSEGGLTAGTVWSATVNGVTQSTSGSALTFYVAAGTYTYSFNAVSGYSLPSSGASGSLTVTNQPVALATTYSPTSTTSYVETSNFNNWIGVAIAVAIIALVIALLALFLRRRREDAAPGAQAWTPPPTSSSETAPTGPEGSSSWSEGPPPS